MLASGDLGGAWTTSPEPILAGDVLSQVDRVGTADILVGIPAFNSAETIGYVITAVEAGLRKHFPDQRAVICVSDGGSEDGTMEVAVRAGVGDDHEQLLVDPTTPVPKKIVFQYRGPSGKGSAFRSIFDVAVAVDAKACAVVDSDLRSITPYWLDRLLGPVVKSGYGFVAPVYSRHKFDGTITNSFAYPLTTALYGERIRQPIGGEFGFSGALARTYAGAEDVWESDVARFGIDIWMTTVAVVEGFRTCQGILGAKIHDPKDPGKDLGPMFRQVVGSLFALAGRYEDRWYDLSEVNTPPRFGFNAAYSAEPIQVSVPRLTWKFVEGYVRHHTLWREVLSEDSMAGVEKAVADAAESTRGLVLEPETWTTIVYDYLVAYNAGEIDAGPLLDSLIPLYFARTGTFVQEVSADSYEEAEMKVEQAVDLAIELKPYLRKRWDERQVSPRPLSDQTVPSGPPPDERLEGAIRAEIP
ncbi:MAG TPA: glycosyl transferase family 2 [Actinomycetota bacterium]|nr:glycosyl transferase family 2 [Actinomycetota bacterium]